MYWRNDRSERSIGGLSNVALERLRRTFGDLAYIVSNYRERPEQIEMAKAVYAAIQRKEILLIEAGVGVGKTFGYLIPALLQKAPDWPVVISTKTINLQEQLFYKDLPVINALRRRQGLRPIEVILSKGKQNYVCPRKVERLQGKNSPLAPFLPAISKWLETTDTGDFGEESAPAVPLNLRPYIWVDKCFPRQCGMSMECPFYAAMRARSSTSGIIVTNHHQLVLDLKLRQSMKGLWPDPWVVIVDEAHGLEDAARSSLGVTISPRNISNLLRRVYKFTWDDSPPEEYLEVAERLLVVGRGSVPREAVEDIGYTGRYPIQISDAFIETAASLYKILGGVLQAANEHQVSHSFAAEDALGAFENVVSDLGTAISRFSFVSNGINVVWAEKVFGEDFSITVAPLFVDKFFQELLWKKDLPVILTSATMAVKGDFGYIKTALGLNGVNKVYTKILGSPFDYENRVRIYVPKDLPEPRPNGKDASDDYTPVLAKRIHELLLKSDGKALVLFTSYRRLEATAAYLKKAGFPHLLLKQGQASPGILLEKFRSDKNSVLLATGAFWEGTDVAGESLSLVIMDKMPFPLPFDPLVRGLANWAKSNGQDPYQTVYLPWMLNMLRQGGGRLIRQEGDSGVVALLDVRAWEDKYRDLVESHLPSAPWTDDLEVIGSWFEQWRENSVPA